MKDVKKANEFNGILEIMRSIEEEKKEQSKEKEKEREKKMEKIRDRKINNDNKASKYILNKKQK